ncbi:MAG TPA: hypothetical protein VMC79_10185, partial [Rectinemataceae bacterium]|nr:hypothetical protein [Rectinemataceae bacterium]
MRFSQFFASFCALRERSPVEKLFPDSRYAIAADLHLGDGGGMDTFGRYRGLAESVLGAVYLAGGHTLVLAGDTEDLRAFWSKDITQSWPRIYALLDEFASQGSLRKLLGERDLGLIRKQRPRYRFHHGLRLDWEGFEFFVLHGHQAARYFAGMDYQDFLQKQLHKPSRIRDEGDMDDAGRLYRTERRLYRASLRLGIATLFGHTGRMLFESRTEYDDLRSSIESLLRRESPKTEEGSSVIDAMLELYRKELARMERHGQVPGMTLQAGEEGSLAPCLFNPGFAGGRKGLNFLEIEGGRLRMVRWVPFARIPRSLRARSLAVDEFEEYGVARCILRETSLASVRDRVELLARRG